MEAKYRESVVTLVVNSAKTPGTIELYDCIKNSSHHSDVDAAIEAAETSDIYPLAVPYEHDVLASYRHRYGTHLPTTGASHQHVIYMPVKDIPGAAKNSLVALGINMSKSSWLSLNHPERIKFLYSALCAIH